MIAILFQALDRSLIVLNYQINKGYYAKYLCENRDKPMKHCEGRCCMCKQLEKAEKKESSPAFPSVIKNEVIWINQYSLNLLLVPNLSYLNTFKRFFDSEFLPDPVQSSVFHPPQFC